MSACILIIDDEEIIRMTSGEILTELGYNVLTAGSGEEGLNILRERSDHISLVILDMSMPGKTGKETYSEIKELLPSMKVLLSSGYKTDEDETFHFIGTGEDGFIQKPYSMSDLSNKLNTMLPA